MEKKLIIPADKHFTSPSQWDELVRAAFCPVAALPGFQVRTYFGDHQHEITIEVITDDEDSTTYKSSWLNGQYYEVYRFHRDQTKKWEHWTQSGWEQM